MPAEQAFLCGTVPEASAAELRWGLDFFGKEPMVLRVSLATY